MIMNPWTLPFAQPPFVLPTDAPLVNAFNLKAGPKRFLQVEHVLPEPFIGNPKAPVVLLSNNPGFGKAAGNIKMEPFFQKAMRANLRHEEVEYPFFYLSPEMTERGEKWWRSKLKCLIREFDLKTIANAVLNVVFFPYPSERFGRKQLRLPSQEYGFQLVRAAIERKAVIIHMRSPTLWLEAVPELAAYKEKRFVVNNTQTPAISPKNLSAYSKVVDAIKTHLPAGA